MADERRPWGAKWRSSQTFILATVAVCTFSDMFLYSLVVPVLPFLLRDRFSIPEDGVQRYTSQLIAIYAGASVLFSIPSGWVADKSGSRRLPILVGSLFLVVGAAMFAFGQSLAVLLIARALQGMAAAVVWTVGLAMVQDSVGSERLGQALGTIISITTTGQLIAPSLGGLLYDAAGIRAVFGLSAGVIAIDFVMRLLAIDSKMAAATEIQNDLPNETSSQGNIETSSEAREVGPNENSPLLSKKNGDNEYKIDTELRGIVRAVPVLYCFRNPRLVGAQYLTIVQGTILGIFDATVANEATSLFGFSSSNSGFLFAALIVPCILLGTVAGWAVDRFGTKTVATCGYAFLVPTLSLLGLPSLGIVTGAANIALYCIILALNGVGLAAIGSPSFVEAIDVIGKYEAANPGFFGENGPYAQIFGFNSVFLFVGFTIGPLLGGALRDAFGYGVMGLLVAALSGITSILSYLIVGPKMHQTNTDSN